MEKRFIPTDYLQDILVESHGVNQDAISFVAYIIGFEKKLQNTAHSSAEISLKYDALKKDDDDTTLLVIGDQLVDLRFKATTQSHASSVCKRNVAAYSAGFLRTKKHYHFHAIMKIFKDAGIE
ncbi:hypothetical protein AgCh_033894 [Apium graveolens]